MGKLEALILDVGGVLIETPTRDARAGWECSHGLEPGEADRLYADAIGPGWEGGRSEAEIHARLCAGFGVGPDGLPAILDMLHADERICPVWADALDEIARTHRLAILTNAGPAARSALLQRHNAGRWFELIVVSAEERISKPDPEIYRRTSARLVIEPVACLFVDDREANVEGALAVGMSAIRFHSSRDTVPQVRRLLNLTA